MCKCYHFLNPVFVISYSCVWQLILSIYFLRSELFDLHPGLLTGLKLSTHYPCPRAVFTGHVPVNTGVQNDALVHGPWSPVYPTRPMNTGVIFDICVRGPCLWVVCTELYLSTATWHSFWTLHLSIIKAEVFAVHLSIFCWIDVLFAWNRPDLVKNAHLIEV